MNIRLEKHDIWIGAVLYAIGDTIAALILGAFSLERLAGMFVLGGTLYALEIPNYFRWIEAKVPDAVPPVKRAFRRTVLALLYFNPLWIARHLLFIRIFSGRWDTVSWALLGIGWESFIWNIPISIVGNYIVQVKVPMRRRFLASSIFSGIMAVYFALSEVFFGG